MDPDDRITRSAGRAICTKAGASRHVLVFSANEQMPDQIMVFEVGQDRIDLSGLSAGHEGGAAWFSGSTLVDALQDAVPA